MASNNTVDFGGILKRVYGDEVINLVPDNATFQKMIPFKASKKIGEAYFESVTLQPDQGFTYAGPDAGAFAFGDPISGVNKQAKVQSYQILGQTLIDFELAARAQSGGSAQAFRSALDLPISNFMLSFRNRLELNMLYGGQALGVVGSVSSTTITITDAEWAAGIWSSLVGAKVDVYVGATTTPRVSGATIVGMNLNQKKITLSSATDVAADDTIYIAGTRGNEALGIHSIVTKSGSLFDIDNTTYNLWSGNTYDVGGTLTQAKLDDASCLAMDKGLGESDRIVIVNPRVWSDLMTEQTARRQFGADSSTMTNGANTLKFRTQSGNLEVMSSSLVKQGYGYLLNKSDFVRIGAVDVTLGDPTGQGPAVRALNTHAAYQVISYSNQALFCRRPGYQTVLTGITLGT